VKTDPIDLSKFKPFDSVYLVSPDGRVYDTRSNKLVTPKLNENGFLSFSLEHRLDVHVYIHHAVANLFLEVPDFLRYCRRDVRHKDGCITNNHVSNLEFIVYTGNKLHRDDSHS